MSKPKKPQTDVDNCLLNKYYQILESLGEGTYGLVSKAIDKKTKNFVAIKKIKIDVESEGLPCSSLREISALSDLKHPNIVTLLNIYNTGKTLYLVFEYCDDDLQKFIKRSQGDIPLELIKTILVQLIKALSYCHSHRTFHRDIKPGNIFMNKDGTVKLGDFGLARVFRSEAKHYTPEVISLWYRAPEILFKMPSYTSAVDMWSVGAIFGELVLKRPMFKGTSERDQIIKIVEVLGIPTQHEWGNGYSYFSDIHVQQSGEDLNTTFQRVGVSGIELLKSMLVYNPNNRVTAANALTHQFLQVK
ncbi:CDK1, putative [Entamoeba invadens IP1]|uniref:Cyclin-dependent kinase 2 n=2 Tax=Entamoeba invadens TaxID=33085 RepID=A0A0A1U073_ENTIV|nr:CDK1, putative [Entamoeba invadens IP1]ELP87290.1 CDK1, putative [Entamoeba invadens IP1]BAN42208.1 CDK1, putative [Entamoeba invadens]|eukprot:XP_004254061.1 CDK1, putative [Entamoeba invadens IP1]